MVAERTGSVNHTSLAGQGLKIIAGSPCFEEEDGKLAQVFLLRLETGRICYKTEFGVVANSYTLAQVVYTTIRPSLAFFQAVQHYENDVAPTTPKYAIGQEMGHLTLISLVPARLYSLQKLFTRRP